MENVVYSGSHAKLFAGFLLNSELKMHLNESPEWKIDKFIPTNLEINLVETRYGEHHYIGLFLPEKQIDLSSLKEYEHKISQQVQLYCPEIDCHHLKFCVFSQLFIQ
jgi:hypothetical protein